MVVWCWFKKKEMLQYCVCVKPFFTLDFAKLKTLQNSLVVRFSNQILLGFLQLCVITVSEVSDEVISLSVRSVCFCLLLRVRVCSIPPATWKEVHFQSVERAWRWPGRACIAGLEILRRWWYLCCIFSWYHDTNRYAH